MYFVDDFKPLKKFNFGHTPTQVKYFKTAAQSGSRKHEYWTHVLQLRTLKNTWDSLKLDRDEAEEEILALEKWQWFPFGHRQRKYKILRAQQRFNLIQDQIREKEREIGLTVAVLQDFSDLFELTESQILEEDELYWAQRLGRQLAVSKISRHLGIGEGEVQAVLALPFDRQQQAFLTMQHTLMNTPLISLPKPEKVTP